MECFVHEGRYAVGSCKFCCKGVCRDCVQDSDAGVVCSQACATEVQNLHILNTQVLKAYGIGESRRLVSAPLLAWGLPGLAFLIFSLYFAFGNDRFWPMTVYLAPTGLIFLIIGIYFHWRNRNSGLNC